MSASRRKERQTTRNRSFQHAKHSSGWFLKSRNYPEECLACKLKGHSRKREGSEFAQASPQSLSQRRSVPISRVCLKEATALSTTTGLFVGRLAQLAG